MKDFEHLKSLWLTQPKDEQLPVEEVLKQVKKDMASLSHKLLSSIIIMAAALAGMLIVLLFFVFHSPVTYIGIIIILSTVFVYGLLMVSDYRLINNRDFTLNTSEYLKQLKTYQRKQQNFYGWAYYVYLSLIGIGLLLYSFEVLQYLSIRMRILIYISTVIWFAFCTFFIKERILKSEQQKVNLLIDWLEKLQHQFKH